MKCLYSPVYTPQSNGNIYKHVPHVFKHIYSISGTAIFLAKNAVVTTLGVNNMHKHIHHMTVKTEKEVKS